MDCMLLTGSSIRFFLANLAHGGVLTFSIAAHPADARDTWGGWEGEALSY